jgi:hypothetical protein
MPWVLLLLASSTLKAQVVSGVSVDQRRIVIAGSSFSATDEVSVAGIALEKLSVSETQIVAQLPDGVSLVAGDYVVRVVGKSTSRGTLKWGRQAGPATAVERDGPIRR